MFPDYYVRRLLRSTGWPQKKGIRRREVISTQVLDVALRQLSMVGVGIGAGRPRLALRLIVAAFDRDLTSDGEVSAVIDLLDRGEKAASRTRGYAWDAIGATDIFGRHEHFEWSWLERPEMLAIIRGKCFLLALGWGLLHPEDADSQIKRYCADAGRWAGLLDVPASDVWDSPEDFYANCDVMVRGFEAESGSLPEPTQALLRHPRVASRL